MKIPAVMNTLLRSRHAPEVKQSFGEVINNARTELSVIHKKQSSTDADAAQSDRVVPTPSPFADFKRQLPHLAKHVLGKRYQSVSQISSMFATPERLDQIADRLFEQVAVFAQAVSRTQTIAQQYISLPVSPNSKQAHAAMQALSKGVELENKLIATIEGAVLSAAGVTGAVIDLPAMVVLALRTIYQTAACYGVKLEGDDGLAVALEVLSEVDLSVFAQKQVILLAIAQTKSMLQDTDLKEFYQWASQNTDPERLRQFVDKLTSRVSEKLRPKYIALNYITPVASASVAGFYNGLVITKVAAQARERFKKN